MKERIVQFLLSEKISPAEFADKIGVQRSSMSHILNGRNHPSAAFLQKMLLVYPLLNPRWLMVGVGSMNTDASDPKVSSDINSTEAMLEDPSSNEEQTNEIEKSAQNQSIKIPSDAKAPDKKDFAEIGVNTQINVPLVSQHPRKEILSGQSEVAEDENLTSNQILPTFDQSTDKREIEQILFFYKDKTFTVYRPS